MALRILHVIPDLGHGGAEHQLLSNLEGLDPARFENHVCHLYPRSILAPAMRQAGATVHSVSVTGTFTAPRRLWKLVRLIRKLRPELIHTSNVLGELYGGMAGRITGTPVAATLTNTSDRDVQLIDHPHLSSLKLGIVTAVRRQVLRHTHSRYIAISKHVAESAAAELDLPRSRIAIIYRGVSPVTFEPASGAVAKLRRELRLEGNSPVLLNVGRLVPQKGQRYLIEAMPRIVARYPSAMLLIVGVGFLEDKLKSHARALGLEDHVRFLGSRDDVPVLLRTADIFVFPSLYEGLGVSLLEACGSGVPVVATQTGPIPEVVLEDETGLLVPPGDPAALASAILRLADEPELRTRLATAAAERVMDKFTIARSLELLEEFYEGTRAAGVARDPRSVNANAPRGRKSGNVRNG